MIYNDLPTRLKNRLFSSNELIARKKIDSQRGLKKINLDIYDIT